MTFKSSRKGFGWLLGSTVIAKFFFAGGRGTEWKGDEAERPRGQVVRKLEGLLKNQNLTLRQLGNHEGLVMGTMG